MIHYHGTPMSGPRANARNFFAGRHALIPFADARDLPAALEVCASVVLDNSAFTYWRRGGSVDVGAYHRWVHLSEGRPRLAWCLIPDIIDGSEEANVELVVTWLRMGSRVKSVPVWHLHESLDWLDHLCANFDTVALGSSGRWKTPGTAAWWLRMAEAMRVACRSDGSPRCALHGLRMLDPAIFRHLPLASADSASAAINSGSPGRFGMYRPKHAWQRATIIAWTIEEEQAAKRWAAPLQSSFALEARP